MGKDYIKLLLVMLFLLVLTITVSAVAPVMNSSRISPTTAYTNNTLLGYCNATDSDGNEVSYHYRIYKGENIILEDVQGVRWLSNSSWISGVSGATQTILTNAFLMDNDLKVITLDWRNNIVKGYNWTSGSFSTQTNLDDGLSGAHRFYDTIPFGSTYITLGGYGGTLYTYLWNSSGWTRNTTLEIGLNGGTSKNNIQGVIFTKGDSYNIVVKSSGTNDNWYGYTWNSSGNNWFINNTWTNGLASHNSYLWLFEVYNYSDILFMTESRRDTFVLSAYQNGYKHNGTSWVSDNDALLGMNSDNGFQPSVVRHNNIYVNIRGETDGNIGYNDPVSSEGYQLNESDFTQGLNINLENISTASTSKGEQFIFSCRASDGTGQSTWLNSSTLTISNLKPILTTPTITPTTAYTNTNLTANLTYIDTDEDSANVTFKWYNDSGLIYTGIVEINADGQVSHTLYYVNFSHFQNITVNVTAFDGDDNSTQTTATRYINNSIPSVTITIYNSTIGLNCSYAYSDNDDDTENSQWFRWYINNTLSSITAQELGSGNYTSDFNLTCEMIVNDGYVNSSWTNSSVYTVGDVTAPTIESVWLSTSSGYTDETHTIYINCSETNELAVGYPKVSFIDPGETRLGDFSMTLDTENTYKKTYSFVTAGTYRNFTFYCKDGTNNEAQNLTNNLTFTSSVRPALVVGGGAVTTPPTPDEEKPLIDFSSPRSYITVLSTPSFVTKILNIKNRGDGQFIGEMVLTDELNKYIDVELCNIERKSCSDKGVIINPGETKILIISGEFDKSLGPGVEGILSLKSSDFTFEHEIIIDRPPGAYIILLFFGDVGYVTFAEFFKISETMAMIAYLCFTVVLIVGIIKS